MKTKAKKEHVITGFVSTAAQYPDHPHQMIEIACIQASERERVREIEPLQDERQFNLDNYLAN